VFVAVCARRRCALSLFPVVVEEEEEEEEGSGRAKSTCMRMELPVDVLHAICSQCTPAEMLSLAQTSTKLRKVTQPLLHEEAARRFSPQKCIERGLQGALAVHLRKGLDLNLRKYAVDWDVFGTPTTWGTLLHLAVYCDNLEALYLLLQAGADLNARDSDGSTPLKTAVRYRRFSFARQLVLSGADIQAKNEKGMTALHYAAKRGTVEMTRMLIKLGANVNATDDFQNTPLHLYTSYEVALELVECGADLSAENCRGVSAASCLSGEILREIEVEKIFTDNIPYELNVSFDIKSL